MTDWVEQAQKVVDEWTTAQRSWWTSVLGAPQAATSADAPEDARKKALDAWKESVDRALDAQSEWTRMWAESVSASAPGTGIQAQQGKEAALRWTELQKQLWDGWFAAVRALQPTAATGAGADAWAEAGKRMLAALQEAAERASKAQADWARTMGPSGAGSRESD